MPAGYVKKKTIRVDASGVGRTVPGSLRIVPVSSGASKKLTNQITRVLNRKTETKYVACHMRNSSGGVDLGTYVGFNNAIGGTSEQYSVLPNVKQGAGDNQRLGDKIKPTKIRVQASFALPSNAINSQISRDIIVDVFFLTAKAVKDAYNYSAVPITELLNLGDGTTQAYDGTEVVSMLPVMSDYFTVLKKYSFRLQKGAGDLNGITPTAGGIMSPTPKSFHKISFTLPKKSCPTLKYGVDTREDPSNFYPFMVVGCRFADSTSTNTTGIPLVWCTALTDMWFKDA